MKKILTFFLMIIVTLGCFVACGKEESKAPLTNEQRITERIETFMTAYNEGDMEEVLNSLAAKPRNQFQAMLNLLGGLAGGLTGVDIDLKDLFSLGVGMESGDYMGIDIQQIEIISAKKAVATTTMRLAHSATQTIYFDMVYEHEDWFINDMTDNKPTSPNENEGSNGSENSNGTNSDNTTTPTYYVTTQSKTTASGMAGTYTTYNKQVFDVGDTVTLEATVNDGYNFVGWYTTEGWNEICLSNDLTYTFTMEAKNYTIEARYSNYTVTTTSYSDEYGTAGTYTKYEGKKVSVGDTVTLEATVNDGFNFEGWYSRWADVRLSKELTYTFNMKAESVEIEARYSYYTVTVDGWNEYGTAGTFTKKDAEKVSVGNTVTITTTVNDGYNFEGWYRNDVCISTNLTYSFEMKAESVYIEPRYSSYHVNVDGWNYYGQAGTYTKKEGEKVSVGNTVTLTATVNSGYRFEGWYRGDVCVSKSLTYSFEMEACDMYLEPRWSEIN